MIRKLEPPRLGGRFERPRRRQAVYESGVSVQSETPPFHQTPTTCCLQSRIEFCATI